MSPATPILAPFIAAVQAERADPTMLATYPVRPTAASGPRVLYFPQTCDTRGLRRLLAPAPARDPAW
jgi:hypothetical protein